MLFTLLCVVNLIVPTATPSRQSIHLILTEADTESLSQLWGIPDPNQSSSLDREAHARRFNATACAHLQDTVEQVMEQ